ncbi:CHD6, partial [Symbiodinium sp. KB8]
MVRMLDVLEDYLTMKNFTFDRIDGSIRAEDRQRAIRRFTTSNTEECFVLLLSTRAAGLGLNLQAANTVILFDSDPNPQADAQAMARTHRIGQQRKVHVYRLISRATYEEALLKRASLKLGLGEAVLSAG